MKEIMCVFCYCRFGASGCEQAKADWFLKLLPDVDVGINGKTTKGGVLIPVCDGCHHTFALTGVPHLVVSLVDGIDEFLVQEVMGS